MKNQTKPLFSELDDQTIASNFVFSIELSKAEKEKASEELKQFLNLKRGALSEKDVVEGELLKMHLQMQRPGLNLSPSGESQQGFYLRKYIDILKLSHAEFAAQISITPAELSHYIHNHRKMPKKIMIRLELHSSGIIPATNWLQLMDWQDMQELKTDKVMRAREQEFVHQNTTSGMHSSTFHH